MTPGHWVDPVPLQCGSQRWSGAGERAQGTCKVGHWDQSPRAPAAGMSSQGKSSFWSSRDVQGHLEPALFHQTQRNTFPAPFLSGWPYDWFWPIGAEKKRHERKTKAINNQPQMLQTRHQAGIKQCRD